ncbi:MAG: SNF2-related protein [Gammaproteobacteria bacterium]|nr:SNF2-related protein [Gammaproteobacteria bacterium]
MNPAQAGQRWINHARPELGLGMVIAAEGRTVTLRFGDDVRDHVFALESAPLSRIRFAAGDVVRTDDGARIAIDSVAERDGIFVYAGTDVEGRRIEVPETAIAPDQLFNRPAERLLHGHIDEDRWFKLRYGTPGEPPSTFCRSLWGLVGGRTALIRHQLHVAREVSQRHAPRVLLADEVGLGKTIEAGMIVHCQLVTERIRRVLVVVPESLVHQWLVEMIRRFNLRFSLFDSARCEAMDPVAVADGPETAWPADGVNPFTEEQLVLVSREFLLAEPSRLVQLAAARFDMLVVDEAHHLQPGEGAAGEAYRMAEKLAAVIPAVLLLTGTPRQLGISGHYSRLRLLDPHRYHDPGGLEREHREFEPVADLVECLTGDGAPGPQQRLLLERLGTGSAAGHGRRQRGSREPRAPRRAPAGPLRHRARHVPQHPCIRRRVLVPACRVPSPRPVAECPAGAGSRCAPVPGTYTDRCRGRRRVVAQRPARGVARGWLKERPGEKALVISGSALTATALADVAGRRAGIRCAAFHEGLSLLERDRAAAWFADPEEGCEALMCSEIGSEGRNFQFADHLVLFDVPLVPDLLEQRIGRLDRIGRRDEVRVHVPCIEGSVTARLVRWYHEGLDAFECVGTVNQLVSERLGDQLATALLDDGADMNRVVEHTRELAEQLAEEMRAGRDRLLEYRSCPPRRADELVEEARRTDADRSLREWLEHALACYDINMEPYRPGSVLLTPGERLLTPVPGLPDTGLAATFDRGTALENEDLAFLTREHPLVQGLADLVMNTERGNATLCAMRHDALPRGRLAVECVFVIEAPRFSEPELACYVPPLLVSEVHDETGSRLDPDIDHDVVNRSWLPLKYKASRQLIEIKRAALKAVLERARNDVAARSRHMLLAHGRAGVERLQEELARLRHLKSVNPDVRQEEIDHHERLLEALRMSLGEPRVRLDAVRVIIGL